MPDAKAIIRITAAPDSALRKAIDGSVAAARKASKDSAATEIKAAKDAEREKLRASKAAEKGAAAAAASAIKAAKAAEKAQVQAVREVHAANRRAAADAQKLARQQAREAEKLAREEVRWSEWAEKLKYQAASKTARMAERAAGQQRRESAKTARQQVKDARDASQGRRRMGMAAAGAAMGVGVAAAGRAASYAGAFGARSREDMAAAGVNFQRRLNALAQAGGMDDVERDTLKAQILKTSGRTGVEADDLLGGLETAQKRFTAMKNFSNVLDELADVAVATNTDVSAVVGAMGVMRRQFNLTDDSMTRLNGAIAVAADLGNVEYADVATQFPSALGQMARTANLKGEQGALTALGLAQVMGGADKTTSETATLITNLMTALGKNQVRQDVAASQADGGFGVRLSKDGVLRDLPTIVRELSAAGFSRPENATRRGETFKDAQAREAMEVLVTQFENDPEKVSKLLNLNSGEGQALIKERLASMNEGVLGKAATVGTRQFASFMQSGEFDRFMSVAVTSADELTQLGAKFPLMSEATDVATGALKGFAAALIAERLMGGGRGGGLLGSGGSAAASLATNTAAGNALGRAASATISQSFSSASTLGKFGLVGQTIGTGLAAYLATREFLELTGLDKSIDNLGAKLYDKLHPKNSASKSFSSGSIVKDAQLTTSAVTAARDQEGTENVLGKYLSGGNGVSPGATIPSPMIPAANAELKIKIDGPGRVTSVASQGFLIETINADTGRRDVFPP